MGTGVYVKLTYLSCHVRNDTGERARHGISEGWHHGWMNIQRIQCASGIEIHIWLTGLTSAKRTRNPSTATAPSNRFGVVVTRWTTVVSESLDQETATRLYPPNIVAMRTADTAINCHYRSLTITLAILCISLVSSLYGLPPSALLSSGPRKGCAAVLTQHFEFSIPYPFRHSYSHHARN
jgi:hypothetical protein